MLLPSVDKQVFMQKQWNWKWIVYLNANQTNFDLRCFAEWLVSKMWSLSKAWKWDFTFFHVQDCNLKLFQNKCFRNVVKSFYTASLLYDVLTQFGELSEEVCDASFLWVTLKSKIINHDFNPWTPSYFCGHLNIHTVPPPLWYDSFSNACHTFNFSCCSGLGLVLQGCALTATDPQWQ